MPLTSFGIGVGHGLEFVRGPVGGAASPLLNDLAAYWKLDETSGTRIDSAGSNNLTDNNTVGSATGKLGNAASFVAANSEYLSVASTPGLQSSSAFTLAFWVKPNTLSPTAQGLLFKGGASPQIEYLIRLNTNTIDFFVNSASDFAEVTGINTTEWWFVVAYYNGTTNLWVQSESGTLLTNTGPAVTHATTTNPLEFGRYWSAAYYSGRIDEVGIWQRVLTSSERTQLYNSGSGLTYPF
jgi:hypothetical protein